MEANLYQPSGRLALGLDTTGTRNPGFSCNYFRVSDSLESIAEAQNWVLKISTNNGAPSVDFSDLRPKGSPISCGGESPGVIPFMHVIDSIMASAKRSHNKNHAGLIGLNWKHPELQAFLDAKFSIASKVVYFEEEDEPTYDDFKLLHKYYVSQPKLFFHKRVGNRGTNLCTEILMPSKGTCVLGTFNVAHYRSYDELATKFPRDFANALRLLIRSDIQLKMRLAAEGWTEYVSFSADNLQVGLSITGLATLIGRLGISYGEFFRHPISGVFEEAYSTARTKAQQRVPYQRFFCQAPLVHSHLKFRDGVTGLHVTPGLEPLEGVRVGEHKICRIVSGVHGNKEYKHPITTPTVEDLNIDTWLKFCSLYKAKFIDQSISFSVFDTGNKFDVDCMVEWFHSHLPSLYYYVPVVPTQDSNDTKFNNIPITCELGKWQHLLDECGCAG